MTSFTRASAIDPGNMEIAGTRIAWGYSRNRAGRRNLGRALLQELLPAGTALTQVCPVCGGPHGPVMTDVDGTAGPFVSISYAGSLAVVGVAPEGSAGIGLDVEVNSASRQAAVREALSDVDAHVSQWTRTEASLKSRGTGLHGRYRGIEFIPEAIEVEGARGWRAKPSAEWTEQHGTLEDIHGFDLTLPQKPGSSDDSPEILLSVALR